MCGGGHHNHGGVAVLSFVFVTGAAVSVFIYMCYVWVGLSDYVFVCDRGVVGLGFVVVGVAVAFVVVVVVVFI